MTNFSIGSQLPIFLGLNGSGLNNGAVYIGMPNQDPQTFPKTVYWDEAGTDPVDQSSGIATVGGYIARMGTPASIYLDGPYSIRALDRFGNQVFYLPYVASAALLLEALLASPAGAGMVGWQAPQAGSVARNQDEVNKDRPSVMDFIDESQWDFIRDNDYASQDPSLVAAGVNAAFTAGVGYMPSGTYYVDAPLIFKSGLAVAGAGRRKTTIRSEVIGDSTFKTDAGCAFWYIGQMSLRGNTLTGVDGNGHAIDLIDNDIAGGAKSPSQGMIYQVEIAGFNGLGRRDSQVSAPSIAACAVIGVNALQNLIRDVYISDCGHGFYFKDCENTRVENCGVDGITKFAALVMSSENTVFLNSTLIDAGDGTPDPNYPATATSLGSGIFCSYQNNGLLVEGSKFKNNYAGNATIQSLFSNNDAFIANWIRADAMTDVTHKGIYALRPTGIVINANIFHPTGTAFTTKSYQTIEVAVEVNGECPSFSIRDNLFGDVAGMNIEYNIKIGGNNSARPVQGVIDGNRFGFREGRVSATVVTYDILLQSCSPRAVRISNNTHVAAANVTRTNCVANSSSTLDRMEVGPNSFLAGGGTITNNYNNITESNLSAVSSSYDPPSLATGASTPIQTTTVTGAALGDVVTASWSANLAGAEIKAYVSAANTVSWYITNTNGTNPLDLSSGTATLRVKRSWAA